MKKIVLLLILIVNLPQLSATFQSFYAISVSTLFTVSDFLTLTFGMYVCMYV